MIRLAPCAVLVSSLAGASTLEIPTTSGGNTNTATPVTGPSLSMPATRLGGSTPGSAPSLQSTFQAGPTPQINPSISGPSGAVASPTGVIPTIPIAGAPLPIKSVKAGAAVVPAGATAIPGGSGAKRAAGSRQEQKDAPPSASSVLDKAADGITEGRKSSAAGVDGISVRQALDRAYDSSARPGDIGGGAASGVAGRFSGAREKIASFVGVANNAAPADAPGLYRSAIKTAEENLPAAAAAAVTKAVLGIAGRKADISLSELAQAAYTAATAGDAKESRRLVKSLDKWEELLGAPGRPLISNGDRLKAGVESTLAGASKIAGSNPSAPRVWVVKRGGSFVAALPGSTVAKVPGLAARFAFNIPYALSLSPMADAYRAFAAKPGLRAAIGARVSLGESVPSAVLGTGWLWLKHLVARAWNSLLSLLPGRSLPSTATAANLPRLRDAAKAWRDAVNLGDAASRAADEPRPTVSRARGAFTTALRAAAAHENLTGEAGAVARITSLSAEFESGVKRATLSPADRLTTGLESIVSGEGGLRHWASRYAADARERGAAAFGRLKGESPVVVLGEGPAALAAPALAAASKNLSVTAFGDALWASGTGDYGRTKIAADLRSTENGGSVTLETERGDESLAASLDKLGFAVTRAGRGLNAKLDAQTISADAAELTELVADGAALISGAPLNRGASVAGLERLLADMRRNPKDAAKAAVGLDGSGRLSRAKTVAWVGDYEAVSTEIRSRGVRVIALRDPATGLSKFARVEPLRVR